MNLYLVWKGTKNIIVMNLSSFKSYGELKKEIELFSPPDEAKIIEATDIESAKKIYQTL